MSPHAIRPHSPDDSSIHSTYEPPTDDALMNSNGKRVNGVGYVGRSHLIPANRDDIHDILCVGFGPASLAIAVALHDAMEDQAIAGLPDFLLGRAPKVAFLERQPKFSWHAGMLLPGTKMQITFLKDLATMRNPKSDFTFVNYLHKKNRLVEFANLGTFLPQRIEFEDYLKWCAEWFEDVTMYNQEVIDVSPDKTWRGSDIVDCFAVTSQNTETGTLSVQKAKHVVIAAGGKAYIPDPFPQSHPRVIHSSQYSHMVPQILTDRTRSYRVAVVGGGQSAAEVFNTLHTQYPNCHTRLIHKGGALRPSDDSPFVNEVFNPDRVDSVYNLPPGMRAASIAEDKNTNYGVVRIELLEHIYETLYAQRIMYENEDEWPHRILNHRTVKDVSNSNGGLVVQLEDRTHPYNPTSEHQEFDLIVVSTGYTRNSHEWLLQHSRHLMPGGGIAKEKWEVARDYRVKFAPGSVSENAGVWLQGCNQETHGLADTLLSILAIRGGEIVKSIFGGEKDKKDGENVQEDE